MPDTGPARKALIARVLAGETAASAEQRCAAFANNVPDEPLRTLVNKVALHSSRIGDADIAAVKAAGFSEDRIFELAVCAAIGQAVREHDTAMAALQAVTGGA